MGNGHTPPPGDGGIQFPTAITVDNTAAICRPSSVVGVSHTVYDVISLSVAARTGLSDTCGTVNSIEGLKAADGNVFSIMLMRGSHRRINAVNIEMCSATLRPAWAVGGQGSALA